jgi:hypothetical protein
LTVEVTRFEKNSPPGTQQQQQNNSQRKLKNKKKMSHLIGVLILKKTEKFHKLFAAAAQTPPRPIASNLGVAPVGSLAR